jgi:hypothetical protein
MHEESRSLDIAVERLAVVQEQTREDLRVLREDVRAEFQTVREEFRGELRELRQDIRRLDNRIFQTLLGVLATLATAVGALITALIA